MSVVQQAVEQVRARFTVLDGKANERQSATISIELDALLSLSPQIIPIVCQTVLTLDEADFEFELPDPRSSLERVRGEPFDGEVINLIEVQPTLNRFKKYIGKPKCVMFYAPYNGILLTCFELEDWFLELSEQISQAEAAAQIQAINVREAESQEKAAELERHTQRIRLLLDDTGFLKLARVKSTAQRTLLKYAKEQEPEAVAAIGVQRMKELMGELRDWVLMRQS